MNGICNSESVYLFHLVIHLLGCFARPMCPHISVGLFGSFGWLCAVLLFFDLVIVRELNVFAHGLQGFVHAFAVGLQELDAQWPDVQLVIGYSVQQKLDEVCFNLP